MQLKIAVLPGDGIGPEVTTEAVNILKAVGEFGGHTFTFTEALIGGVAITETGSPLPQATLDLALGSDAVLLGAVGDNKFNALPPSSAPKPASSTSARPSAASPISAPPSPTKPSPPARPSSPRSPTPLTSSSFASSSAASTSASPAGGIARRHRRRRRSHQHHALHQRRDRPRRPHRL